MSDEVEQTRTDWMSQFVRSVTEAGLAADREGADGRRARPGRPGDTPPTP